MARKPQCLVAIDGQNLMTTTINEWGFEKKINLQRLKDYIINFLKSKGIELASMRYYIGNNVNGEFVKALRYHNYAIRKSRNYYKDNVDVLLATEVALQKDNFDVFLLIAGDGDYVDLLEGLFHSGKTIYALFFDGAPVSNSIKDLLGFNFIDINLVKNELIFHPD